MPMHAHLLQFTVKAGYKQMMIATVGALSASVHKALPLQLSRAMCDSARILVFCMLSRVQHTESCHMTPLW